MTDSSPEPPTSAPVSRRALLKVGGSGLAAGLAGNALAASTEGIHWHDQADVIVCGSGAAGAMAALAARKAGASCIVLEKSAVWGGTSAKSGFHIWIPNNQQLRNAGYTDSQADCLRYMAEQSFPQLYNPSDEYLGLHPLHYDLLATFYNEASTTVDLLSEWGVVDFKMARLGMDQIAAVDYNENSPRNKTPVGRSLMPVDRNGRMEMGRYTTEQMRLKLIDLGADIRLRHEAEKLIKNAQGDVIGIQVKQGDNTLNLRARRGVIFGSGCYTQNDRYMTQFQMMPTMGGCGAASNTGDFIRIGGEAGAQLGNLSGAWRAQIILEDNINYVATPAAVFWPVGDSMFIVNKYGRRCVNEKRNYNDRTKALYQYDPNRCEFPNLINFMIFDQRCVDIYGGGYPIPAMPEREDFVAVGNSLEELSADIRSRLKKHAAHVGSIELADDFAEVLQASLQRFNAMARKGVDEDFQRGQFDYDKAWHNMQRRPVNEKWPEPSHPNNPTMYPLQTHGPYYAMILLPGCLGTNGGPVINSKGEVLDYRDKAIAGLYGAGNCIASPAANAYWGGGTTIGTALTFGRLAGEHAAKATIKEVV